MTILSSAAAANSGERHRKPITETLRRQSSVVDVCRRRKNPPVGEEHPPAVPLLVAGDHPLELRRRAIERAVAEPPLHLQKLAERRRPGVVVAAELPPPAPSLRRRHGGAGLFFFLAAAAVLLAPPVASAAELGFRCCDGTLNAMVGKFTPIRVPNVVLLSWKNDPVDYHSKPQK
ncbi:hypothetical protein E2542_SST31086 [Spatholobus suberectus]|nr:hypothetical protein E2542_SST31086 [Spatholobus suberectus]